MNQRLAGIAALIITFCGVFSFHQAICQTGPDTCWAFYIDGTDPSPYTQGKNISKAATLSDGFVICGTEYEDIFPSRHGSSIGRTTYGGIYIAKYNFEGKLVWLDYGIDPMYVMRQQDNLTVTTDPFDNIYICGIFPFDAFFYYNGGMSSSHIAATDTTSDPGYSFIAKLDKNGSLIWHTSVAGDQPTNIAYAPDNQLIVAGKSEEDNAIYIKGTIADTISRHQISIFSSTYNNIQFLYWLDTAGNLLKHTKINEQATNYRGVTGMTADAASNLFILGQYEDVISFPSVGMTDSIYLAPDTLGPRLYVAKYDSAGHPLWTVHDKKRPDLGDGSTPSSICAGPDGTIYVSTEADYWNSSDSLYFFNKDHSVEKVQHGPWMVYSISNSGFLKWAAGGNFLGYGGVITHDSIVTSIAYKSQASPVWFNDTIYAANNNNLYFPTSNANFFIANFDTAGNVLGATKAGYSNGPMNYLDLNLIPGNNGSVIVYGDAEKYNGTDSMVVFYDTLNFDGIDGFVAKFNVGGCDLPSATAIANYGSSGAVLKLYPNPYNECDNDPLTVESNEIIESATLYNIVGMKCGEWIELNSRNFVLNLPGVTSGMYFLNCKRPDGTYLATLKLVIH